MPHEAKQPAENTSQLRAAIDAGAAKDKVAYPDPAAAPLGTDAEAGGFPPKPSEIRAQPLWQAAPRNQNLDRLIYPCLATAISAAYLLTVAIAA